MKRVAALFWELFKISLFVIGGGYAIIAVADEIFAKKGWTEEGELVDRLPVFQMVPGLIATHTAVYVGNKIAGALGAAVGVVAVALPSVVIFTFVSMPAMTMVNASAGSMDLMTPLSSAPFLRVTTESFSCASAMKGMSIISSSNSFFIWMLVLS